MDRRSVQWLAKVGLTPKRFIKVFRDEIGLSPKLFCRVRRFQNVVQAIERLRTVQWAVRLASSCGYSDQRHLIRDFREFTKQIEEPSRQPCAREPHPRLEEKTFNTACLLPARLQGTGGDDYPRFLQNQ